MLLYSRFWDLTFAVMLLSAIAAAWCSLLCALAALHKLAGSSAKHCSTASRHESGSSRNDAAASLVCC
jgi:hypothetical protein